MFVYLIVSLVVCGAWFLINLLGTFGSDDAAEIGLCAITSLVLGVAIVGLSLALASA